MRKIIILILVLLMQLVELLATCIYKAFIRHMILLEQQMYLVQATALQNNTKSHIMQ